VSLSGHNLVVGAPWQQVNNSEQQGAAYIFTDSGGPWLQTAELNASDGASSAEFGTSVAIADETVAVGAPGANGQGAAYVFTHSGGAWSQATELPFPNDVANDSFGETVSLSGDILAVGAPDHNVGQKSLAGVAYIFTNKDGEWSQTTKLAVAHRNEGEEFGFSVAVSGASALVGAPGKDVGSNDFEGAVFAFDS
jgi:hypothetical protein